MLKLYDYEDKGQEEAKPASVEEIRKRLKELADQIGGDGGRAIITRLGGTGEPAPIEPTEPIRGTQESNSGDKAKVEPVRP